MLQPRLANPPPLLPRDDFHFGNIARPRNNNNYIDDISLIVSSVVAHDKLSQSPPRHSPPGQSHPPPPSPPSPPSTDSPDYHYVPSPHHQLDTPSPDPMYSGRYSDASVPPPPSHSYSLQHPQSHSRRSPPAILPEGSLAHLPESAPQPAPYPASPLSSPEVQSRPPNFSFPTPMSAPHSQQLFAFSPPAPPVPSAAAPLSALNYPTLDRRMSEPVLGGARQTFPAVSSTAGSGTSSFAYDAPSSSAATTVLPSPISPRPSSASFSSYSSYGHVRQGSGEFSASTNSGWTLKHSASVGDFDHDPTVPPISPVYGGSVSGSEASGPGAPSPSRGSPRKTPQGAPVRSGSAASGRTGNSKTYSFVALPGNAVKKRPRRRYDEIERLYQCSWPNCTKAYGTLNHLNAHVTMQKHGVKRSPGEFKELRKQWRQQKKEADEQEREREAHAQALAAMRDSYTHPHLHPHELDHQTLSSRHSRRRLSLDPYPDPHGHHLQYAGGFQSPTSGYALANMAPSAGYLPSPIDDVRYVHPSAHHPHPHAHHGQTDDDLQGIAQFYESQQQHQQQHQQHSHHAHGNMSWPGQPPHHQQSELRHAQTMPMVSLTGATRPLHPYFSQPSPAPHHQQPQMGLPLSATGSSFSGLGAAASSANDERMHYHHHGHGHPNGSVASASGGVGFALGSNRLPPDSTLLTPLPGYEPESDMMMEQRYPAGSQGTTGSSAHGQVTEELYRREYD